MDLLVLSPHLDDAVFSCGGLISKQIRAGGTAEVVTLYAGEPNLERLPASLRRFCNLEERKAEDLAATAHLGASARWLPFVERAFRSPPLSGFPAVFRTPAAATAEAFVNLEAIEESIVQLLDRHREAELLLPLGVGNHIDHVELFVAGVQALERTQAYARVRFYEDAYAIGARARRQHFVTRQRPWRRGEAPERVSLRAWVMFSALALARRGPPVEALLPPGAARLVWRCEVGAMADDEARKLEAVAKYASQVAMLGGEDAWCELQRRYHRLWGGAEPLWRACPGCPGV